MIDQPAREVDLALAHLHLRLGSLALARAELETLAGRAALDPAGLVDLAEARWRMGDLAGAGEAAAAALGDADDGPLVALVVAAEAALHRGRPTEARRYANRAMAVAGGAIDDVFAGTPRGHIWPPDALAPSLPAPTLFDAPAGVVRPPAQPSDPAPEPASTVVRRPEPASLALWEDAGPEPGSTPVGSVDDLAEGSVELPTGDETLLAGRDALAAGDLAAAAVHFALTLRTLPALAPAVLDAIEARSERELAFVRGDAYRLLGRELDARRAFAVAARPLNAAAPAASEPTDPPRAADPPPASEPPPEGDPA